MDIFKALPNAVIRNTWEIGNVERATRIGKEFTSIRLCDVIVEEGVYNDADRSPNADYQSTDTLLYAKPNQMPTLDTPALAEGYLWHNTQNNQFYEIREASLGTNQETGNVEHVEFLLRPTEVAINE